MQAIPNSLALDDLLDIFGILARPGTIKRHNHAVFDTQRHENVAEHSYNLAVLSCTLAQYYNATRAAKLNPGTISQYALVHDISEAVMDAGDISVFADASLLATKHAAEAAALQQITRMTTAFPWAAETLKTYETQQSEEARFVYAVDKLIVHLVVLINDRHHLQPTHARYRETEAVAHSKIAKSYPALLPVFETLCAAFYEKPHLFRINHP